MKKNTFKSSALIACLSTLPVLVLASGVDLTAREEGWFWYEDPPPLQEEGLEELPPAPLVIPIPPEDPDPVAESEKDPGPPVMSTAWIRENLPIAMERAIDEPTEKNLLIFAYLRRAAFDKAERFAYEMRDIVLTDPLLDENNRAPISIAASRALRSRKKDEDEAKLKLLADRVGFFYFHDDTCTYCQQQVPILEKLQKEYGFKFLAIGVGNSQLEGVSFPARMDEGQAQTLEVSRVPSIVMVWPDDNAAVLTQSYVPQSAFEARTITIARQLDILTDSDLEEMGIEQETLFVDLDLDDPDDLYQWVLNVRREMGYE